MSIESGHSTMTPDFQVLFESAPGLFLVLTPDFVIVAVSDAYLRATMTKREAILGRGIFEVFPDNPTDPSATGVRNLRLSLERVLKERVADTMAVQKYDIRRPDSEGGEFEERYWSPVNSPVLGANNEVAYIIHRVEDVTEFVRLEMRGIEQEELTQELRTRGDQMEAEVSRRGQEIIQRKQAEQAIAKYLERLRILHQIDTALIAGKGPAEIAASALQPLRELLGVSRTIVNLFDVAKGEVEWLAAAGRRQVRVGPGVRFSIQFMGNLEALRRGEPQFIDTHALPPSPEVDALLASGIHAYAVVPMIADGELIGALSFGGESMPMTATQINIAEEAATQFAIALTQSRLHERVKRQEQELRSAFDHTNVAMVLTDLDNRFVRVNDAFARMFGYSRDEILQLSMAEITHPEDVAESLACRKTLATGESPFFQIEKRYLHKDGHVLWGMTNISLIRDSEGAPLQYVGQVQDITERKRVGLMLHERSVHAALSADVGIAFTSSESLQEILQHCVESMVRNLDAAFARVWTLNEADNVLELQASAGLYTHIDGPYGRVPVGKYNIGLIAQERKPHVTNDVLHDPRVSDPEWAKREGMVAFAGYPLLLEDRVVGVMAMFARKNLSSTTLQAMSTVATQIALGIERKLNEEALRESEGRIRELTEHVDQVLWTIDVKESKVLYVSLGYEKMWGRSCQSLLDNPQSYMEGIHPLDLEMMNRANVSMFQTGYIDVECRILRPDGTTCWAWVRGYPVMVEGQILRIVGVVEDITEKRRLASERDALLSRLQLHLERLPLAYVRFDSDLCVIDWNPTAERIFGYTKEEMLGEGPPYEKIAPRSFWEDSGAEIINRLRAGEMDAHSINQNLTKDGRIITCQWFNTPLMDDDGQFVGFLCLAQDVTAQKSMEAQLQQAQKMEAVGQLAGGVAHDFNNLLTIISGYTELLIETLRPDDPAQQFLEEIQKAGERSASLTRQLLAFSRKQVIVPQILDLNGVIQDTEKMLRRVIGEDIEFITLLHPQLGRVKADPGQLEQVLLNLAVNARDAMPQGGKLTVETDNVELDEEYAKAHAGVRPGPYVRLALTDSGVGMTAEIKRHIFEPFFTTKEVGKGTGLGLAVVHGVVKQSDGHIDVYSEPGIGTCFKIYLPRVQPVAKPGSSLKGLASIPRGTETILLVEDESIVRGLARHVLEEFGYTVLAAGNSDEALSLCAKYQGPIHLLLTDVVLPGLGGRQVAEQVIALYPQIKVLYMSGYTDDTVVRHGILHKQVNFLQKPFSPAALAQKVRQVLT